MPGPLKGPGKFWNIDPIWGYILLILATNCAFRFSLYFQFDQTFLTPPYYGKHFGPPFPVAQNVFGTPPFCPPPHQSIYERSLKWTIPHGGQNCVKNTTLCIQGQCLFWTHQLFQVSCLLPSFGRLSKSVLTKCDNCLEVRWTIPHLLWQKVDFRYIKV